MCFEENAEQDLSYGRTHSSGLAQPESRQRLEPLGKRVGLLDGRPQVPYRLDGQGAI